MDWFSWLSKGSLDPSLVYEYGRAFGLNELQEEDISYFDHEFLQSMGISVAKHRLEILKLAKKERGGPRPISGLVMALNRTKTSVGKYISKLVFHDQERDVRASPEPNRYRDQWRGALLSKKHKSEKEEVKEKTIVHQDRRNMALSGPLVDGRVQDKYLLAHKSQKFSGPLDNRAHQKPVFAPPRCPSPKFSSGPLDRRVHEKAYPMRSPKLTGPLDGRVQERFTVPRSPKLSGPLERTAHSPKRLWSDPNKVKMDAYEYDEQSLWTKLFNDMKPT
ncbi:uncharacterized protein LOC115752557 [Rhodamnia argentea]|uniref:Uncharacterized protein LOC115752557 n=1 Tax=Rhodamnia argentea TaxID=178133 RepID=A0A8B8QHQ9_9MYRT|nr:uncharacterized protein LOC115752557 [Rhodamnia argentea]